MAHFHHTTEFYVIQLCLTSEYIKYLNTIPGKKYLSTKRITNVNQSCSQKLSLTSFPVKYKYASNSWPIKSFTCNVRQQRRHSLRVVTPEGNSSVSAIYYSFKIFPRLWLAKSTRIIHHNQFLMTKFGRMLCLTRKWRQKCSVLAG